MTVPCGKCMACLSNRRKQWTFRLKQELNSSLSAFFLTLTYDDEHIPYVDGLPAVSKRDVQLWLKRLRKAISPIQIRYFIVSEYGSRTFRPHYHALLFNFPIEVDLQSILEKTWSNGFVSVGSVTGASISYCAKYCLQYSDFPNEYVRPFMLCSRKPAIGSSYLTDDMIAYHKRTMANYTNENGVKAPLPKYYKDKIFNKFERDLISVSAKNEAVKNAQRVEKNYERYNRQRLENGQSTMQTQKKEDYTRRVSKILNKGKL